MRRRWIVDEQNEYGDLDREVVQQALVDAEALLHQVGGSLSVVAIRHEVGKDMFVTQGYVFQWDSFAPAQRQSSEQPTQVMETLPPDPDRDVELAA